MNDVPWFHLIYWISRTDCCCCGCKYRFPQVLNWLVSGPYRAGHNRAGWQWGKTSHLESQNDAAEGHGDTTALCAEPVEVEPLGFVLLDLGLEVDDPGGPFQLRPSCDPVIL